MNYCRLVGWLLLITFWVLLFLTNGHNINVPVWEISTISQACYFLFKGMILCLSFLMFGMAEILDELDKK